MKRFIKIYWPFFALVLVGAALELAVLALLLAR
jgi:hypothetical protein